MRKLLLAFGLAAVMLVPSTAFSQIYLGVQGNYGDRFKWSIGGRVSADLTQQRLPVMIVGSYDYFWPNESLLFSFDYWEVNVNALFIQRVYGGAANYAQGYAGIGLNIADLTSTEKSSGNKSSATEYGLNLLAGSKYIMGRVSPYFEIGFTFGGSEQVKFTVGIDLALAQQF
jgi:hypothetical protein